MSTRTSTHSDRAALRLAVLNSHPIQYFAPLYAYLNADPAMEVTALYMSDLSLRGGRDKGFGQAITWDIDLLAGYRSIFLGEAAKRRSPGGFFSLMAPEAWSIVRNGGFDALLVHGHNYAGSLIAIAAAKSAGIPVFVRGETHLGLNRRRWKQALRRPVMGAFYRLVDRALAIGSANADFYRAMGVPDDRIFQVPYTVDNERFTADSRLTAKQRTEWRRRFGIPEDRPAILYAAKFTRRKHPENVLVAAARVRARTERPFTIVMCGSGELEPELRAYCQAEGLDNVVFTGFVNQAELPKLYGACDAFVLPSENEPWGLAVNEAMCAGLPIVVSAEVGCVRDLVSDGVNGFTPAARDVEALAAAFTTLVSDDELRARQGVASRERIAGWSYRECLNGILAAYDSLDLQRGRVFRGPARRAAAGGAQA